MGKVQQQDLQRPSKRTRLPNIDRLATNGVRFRNSFTPSRICVPAQILSGRWGHETGNRWGNRS